MTAEEQLRAALKALVDAAEELNGIAVLADWFSEKQILGKSLEILQAAIAEAKRVLALGSL